MSEHDPTTFDKTSAPATTIAVLAGLAAIGTLSTTIILPVFPLISADMNVNPGDMSLALSAFFVAFACTQLIVGPLSDRYGRRIPILAGLGCFLCGTAICGFAASFDMLVAGRVVQAIGISAPFVLSRAIARDRFEGLALARTLALVIVAMSAAPGFSPLLGSVLGAVSGWRSTFAFVGIAAVVLAAGYLGLGETHPADRRAADSPGTILRAYADLATDLRFILPTLAVALTMGALNAIFGSAPIVLQDQLGLSATEMGLFFAATVFVVFALGLLAPRLARRFGPTRAAFAGAVIACTGALLLFGLARTPGFLGYAACISLFLCGMGLLNPLATAIALQPFAARAGLASSLLGALQMLSAGISVTLVNRLPMHPFAALGLVLVCSMALATAVLLAVLIRGAPRSVSNDIKVQS